jgi:hypothetical protein
MKMPIKYPVLTTDRTGRCYYIPSQKMAKFEEWVAYVSGAKREYDGEDFSDYRRDRPLGTLVLTNPYRRFSRRSPQRRIK